jgi:hypothetical protein
VRKGNEMIKQPDCNVNLSFDELFAVYVVLRKHAPKLTGPFEDATKANVNLNNLYELIGNSIEPDYEPIAEVVGAKLRDAFPILILNNFGRAIKTLEASDAWCSGFFLTQQGYTIEHITNIREIVLRGNKLTLYGNNCGNTWSEEFSITQKSADKLRKVIPNELIYTIK